MPSEEESRLRPVFDEAVAARHAGDYPRAIELGERILAELEGEEPRLRASTHAELGASHLFGSKSYARAEEHYGKAAAIQPGAELFSLGLFHALVHQQNWQAALEEMCRFLALRPSAEYGFLLQSDGFAEKAFVHPAERALVSRAHALLRDWASKPGSS
jgi:tetratricopeptide (TPR) repeat protein